MDPTTFAALSRLLDDALDLPPSARLAWVDGLPSEHDALKPRLRAMLAGARPGLTTLPALGGDDAARGLVAGGEVGPYRLLREIGAGGMGAVWLAERTDGLVNRPVALKLPRAGAAGSGLAERMAREREILAALNHPNIARLYDAGVTADGRPYLALEYVEGESIERYCESRRVDLRCRLRLLSQVAEAVMHAHGKLVVHRDLKPSNILVTGEGQVRLLDFGVAKLLEGGAGRGAQLTELAGCAMTPDYASPEQIADEPITIRSDVYSLGVVAFELLTGARPYRLRRDTRAALEEAIASADPPRPSDAARDPGRRRALRGDLDTIVLKALKKRPEERYATVNALADDLERHLSGRPVLARADRASYRLAKFVRRHRLVVGAGAAVAAALVGGSGVAVWQARVAVAEARRAVVVKEFVSAVLRDADPFVGTGKAIDLLKQAREKIDRLHDAGPEVRVELLNTLAWSLLSYQAPADAEAVVEQAIAEAERGLAPEHPQRLRARVLRTVVYRSRGKNRETRAEFDVLLPVLRRAAADVPQDLARALRNSANLALHEGRYAAAVAEAGEAYALSAARFGERHEEAATSAVVLALARLHGDDETQALLAAERAYELTLAARGGNAKHPGVIEARALRGRALAAAGRLDEAVEWLERAVADAAGVFGEDGMGVGFYSEALAEAQLDRGRVAEALRHSERALAIVTAHARPDSYAAAVALRVRGEVLLAARQAEAALPLLAQARAAFEGALGPSHDVTQSARLLRALALAHAGDEAEARRELADLAAAGAGGAAHGLGVLERLAGRYDEASRLQEEALARVPPGPRAARDRRRILDELSLARAEPAPRGGTARR
jgi:eukaryotic-like serine/threonine-protein kinase